MPCQLPPIVPYQIQAPCDEGHGGFGQHEAHGGCRRAQGAPRKFRLNKRANQQVCDVLGHSMQFT